MAENSLASAVARELNSREVARIIGGMLGGLAFLAPGKTIYEGLDFYYRQRERMEKFYDQAFEQSLKAGIVIKRGVSCPATGPEKTS